MKKQDVYMALRTEGQHLDRLFLQLEGLIESARIKEGVNAGIVGLSDDGERTVITVKISVPRSNCDPVALACLNFAYKVNQSFFDHGTFYRGEPIPEESLSLASYLAFRRDTKKEAQYERTAASLS